MEIKLVLNLLQFQLHLKGDYLSELTLDPIKRKSTQINPIVFNKIDYIPLINETSVIF